MVLHSFASHLRLIGQVFAQTFFRPGQNLAQQCGVAAQSHRRATDGPTPSSISFMKRATCSLVAASVLAAASARTARTACQVLGEMPARTATAPAPAPAAPEKYHRSLIPPNLPWNTAPQIRARLLLTRGNQGDPSDCGNDQASIHFPVERQSDVTACRQCTPNSRLMSWRLMASHGGEGTVPKLN
jgi:hypothetical protein